MKTLLPLVRLALLLLLCASCRKPIPETESDLLAQGRQPQVATDASGVVRVVYGQHEKIYCATSTDQGETFAAPVLVGQLKGLYLGMSMGPQIASSAHYSVVTAIDKKGNIYAYKLHHGSPQWVKAGQVNDMPGSAPEGLMSIAADANDTFYAVWLDVRDGEKNKILFASTSGKAGTWAANRIIYESPDSTVCECCKPSLDVKGGQVVLMFRNWLSGARDFYFTRSTDGGQTFAPPQKLGTGTWKIAGCPMDGGGIVLDKDNRIHTTWQRDGMIFYAQPGKQEVPLSSGRNCRISGTQHPVISWKEGNDLKVKPLDGDSTITVGKGSYIETAELADKKTLCVWEQDGAIHFKTI